MYGMNVYLDMKSITEKVAKTSVSHIKGILGLKGRVSTRGLMATLGMEPVESKLLPRLIQNIYKYENHFGEKTSLYNEVLDKFFKWYGNIEKDWKDVKKDIKERTTTACSKEIGIEIGEGFWKVIGSLFQYPDGRDHYLIKYFIGYGYISEHFKSSCPHCGEKNCCRRHVTNYCVKFDELRKKTLLEIGKLIGVSNFTSENTDVEKLLFDLYFNPRVTKNSQYEDNCCVEEIQHTIIQRESNTLI